MITCPSCGAQVPDQDRCPACDYPIILRRGEAAPAPPAPSAAPPSLGSPSFGSGGADPYGANPFAQPGQPGHQGQQGGYQGGYADAPLPGLARGAGAPAGNQPGYPPGAYPGTGYPGAAQPGGAYPGADPAGGYPGADGTVSCPNPACRHPNPARRTLCERCGWYLRPQPVPEPEAPFAPAPAPAPQQRGSRRTPLVLAGIGVALLATAGFAVRGLLSIGGHDEPKTPVATKSAPATGKSGGPETYVVDAAQITAKASSVQKKAGSVTYTAANLLDGKLNTAWNSNGDKVGDGKGVTLTFTFDEPLHLRGIAVLNGYQKTSKDDGKDLFEANARVAAFTVTTDQQTAEWSLDDGRDPQKLEQDLGETSKVTLTVTDVYPGKEYKDLAVSEISFLAQR